MIYGVIEVRLKKPKGFVADRYKSKHFAMISKIYKTDKHNNSTIWIRSYKFSINEKPYYLECKNFNPY